MLTVFEEERYATGIMRVTVVPCVVRGLMWDPRHHMRAASSKAMAMETACHAVSCPLYR